MPEAVCKHCGSALTMKALVKTTEEGYEYACDACAIRERGDVRPAA